MIWFMTTVHVRANQTTVDWAEGAEFVCERTPFVDNLIQHGGLTELESVPEFSVDKFRTDPSQPFVTYRDDSTPKGDVDVRQAEAQLTAAYSNIESSAEDRRSAELALDEAQKKSVSAQENLTEARTDAVDTIAELNTELDNEPPKTTRSRRKAT